MNNDLISREALKKAIENYLAKRQDVIIWDVDLFDILENAPTIEPFEPDYVGAERLKARQRGYEDGYRNGMEIGKTLNPKIKQGEWITAYSEKKKKVNKCRACGFISIQGKTNFCPNCGADMREEGKE